MINNWEDIKNINLSEAEKKLVEAAKAGKQCTIGQSRPEKFEPGKSIRSSLLRYLIMGGCKDFMVHSRGIRIKGAYIIGNLDISFMNARGGIGLLDCKLEKGINAFQLSALKIEMSGTYLKKFNASNVNISGSVNLDKGFHCEEDFSLSNANIGGQLVLSGSKFNKEVNAESVRVGSDVFMDDGFEAKGEVSISGATIGGQMVCTNGNFFNHKSTSLNADDVKIGGSVYLNDTFLSKGRVSFSGASIGGQLYCDRGRFLNYARVSLDLGGSQIRGSASLSNEFISVGEVIINGATVDGQVNLTGGRFINKNSSAIDADSLKVSRDLFMGKGFQARGEVSLIGASINGRMICGGGVFRNPGSDTINAQNIKINGDLFLSRGFLSEGRVYFAGAKIGGQISCSKGVFKNKNGVSLGLQSIVLGEGLFIGNGFVAEGRVDLSGSVINGQLNCNGGQFESEKGSAFSALRMVVKRSFMWKNVNVVNGGVVLASSCVGDLVDDFKSWNFKGNLILDGFIYERIIASSLDINKRLEWLKKGSIFRGNFYPQPYVHFSKVMREMGHDQDSKDALVEKSKLFYLQRRKNILVTPNGDISVAFRSTYSKVLFLINLIYDYSLRIVVGYGYKPGRSFWSLAVLLTLSAFIASSAWKTGALVPNSDVIIVSSGWQEVKNFTHASQMWSRPGGEGADWETFNAYAWAIDVVVPIVELGQVDAWAPSATRSFWGWVAWWSRWVFSILGWIVAALTASAITGVIRRD